MCVLVKHRTLLICSLKNQIFCHNMLLDFMISSIENIPSGPGLLTIGKNPYRAIK